VTCPGRWPGWLAGAFTGGELEALQAVVDQERQRPVPRGHLAHGDFDATHIWLDDHGRYAGIIDFGEMRGADRHFDLGHFLLHDRAPVPFRCSRTSSLATPRPPPWPGITAI
jgi:aminoglycoside phosphotransferase (APT) family kinase protein